MLLNKKTKNKLKITNNTVNKPDKISTNFNSSNSSTSSNSSHHDNNETSSNIKQQQQTRQQQNDQPASTSLWIGNVDPSVTEEVLIEMFSLYGQLANVRCLPDKYCAFVNFKTKEDAQKAMQALQVSFYTQNLN